MRLDPGRARHLRLRLGCAMATVAFITLVGTAACEQAGGGGAADGAAGGSGRTVTLRVLNWAGDMEVRTEQRIADRFTRSHPEVRVVVESVVTNYDEKLLTSIASGTPPDVYLLDAPDIPTFLDRGLALDLTRYLPRVGFDTADVFPEVLDIFRRGGRTYALPKGLTPMVIYYNKAVFRRFHVPFPPPDGWTREQFLATCVALTRDVDGDGRIDVYAFDFPRNLYQWVPWVWSGGGDILSPDGTRATGYLNSRPTVETFRFLTDLVTRYRVTPSVQYLETGDPAREARFYSGGQAMLLSGHWTMTQLADYLDRGDLEIGIAPIPHTPGVPTTSVIYASGWAVPPNVAHKRLAIQLAAFLASEEAQRIRVASRLELPTLESVARAIADRDTAGVEAAFLRAIDGARMTWGARVRDFHEVEDLAFHIMDRRLLRGEDLATTATEVAREIDGVVGR